MFQSALFVLNSALIFLLRHEIAWALTVICHPSSFIQWEFSYVILDRRKHQHPKIAHWNKSAAM